jgi:multidrug resistance efflux pump
VHAGQIVATLDASAYDAQLREAVAEREEADAVLRRAHAEVSGFKTAMEDAQMKLTRAEALRNGPRGLAIRRPGNSRRLPSARASPTKDGPSW